MADVSRPILYVEDTPDDVLFMQRAFKLAGIEHPLQIATGGGEAIAYLSGRDQYADRKLYPPPIMVLIDLVMPLPSGFEVLQWIRTTPALMGLPVLVVTSLDQKAKIYRASMLGANGYLVKPENPEDLFETIKAFKSYWLERDSFVGLDLPAEAEPPVS